MSTIALSLEFLGKYGAQIQNVAPDEVSLLVVDGEPPSAEWREAEILVKSEFANGARPDEVIAQMPRLRWVHSIYAGTDDIPWDEVTRRSIIVTNSAGVYAPMMAEYAIGMVIMLYRNFHIYAAAQREHDGGKHRNPDLPPQELYGKRMGILGYGAVGRYLTGVANAMGMRVWALRRTPAVDSNEPVERMLGTDELDVLLRECDIVVIAASLNSSTRGLLGEREFRMMKRDAVLVNVARGAILDEDALVRALREGWIRGAALDVTTIEPLPPESPLWDLPNVLITPHISGEMPIGRIRSMDLFCRNLKLYLSGQANSMGNRVQAAAHV